MYDFQNQFGCNPKIKIIIRNMDLENMRPYTPGVDICEMTVVNPAADLWGFWAE